MTPDEWKMVLFLEVEDFVDYWKCHVESGNFTKQMQFDEWLEKFISFSKDRQ